MLCPLAAAPKRRQTLHQRRKMWKEACDQTSVPATGRMTNVVSGKRLVCCNAEDVHLNSIDFLPVPAPTGANSANLIDPGLLRGKLDKAEENPDTIPARSE